MILTITAERQGLRLYYLDEYGRSRKETVPPEGKTFWSSYAALVGQDGIRTFSCLGNIPGQQFEKYRLVHDSIWWDGVNNARRHPLCYVRPEETLVI